MFKWLNKQGVISDDGFSFQRIGRFNYRYFEGNFELDIVIEPGNVETLYLDEELKWNTPNQTKKITEQERAKILQNIETALGFMQVQFLISK